MKLYKALNEDLSCIYGKGKWIEGWMPPIEGRLVSCANGYHLCREQDLIEWLGPVIYEAEYRGELIEADNKIVVREARLVRKIESWNERTQRLFACACAEHVLHIYEKEHPNDLRVRKCIEVARLRADGKATLQELSYARAAAEDAAWDAARAAEDAAWDAARAAGDAALVAAWAAARDSVRDARAVEKEWQTQTLFKYLAQE